MTEEDLKELASQLGKPNGNIGIEVADNMNEHNIGMTINGVTSLNITTGDKVLELGHGNAAHVKIITENVDNIRYFGLEISELMKDEAIKLNEKLINSGQAEFKSYNGEEIPFPDNYFDKCFTVNTIYFWNNPTALLSEIHRVIKPGGTFSVVFALEKFMEKLPFTKYGFKLYSIEKFNEVINTTLFKITNTQTTIETVTSKTGDSVEREYAIIQLKA